MHAQFGTFHWLLNYSVLFDRTVDLKVSTTNYTDIRQPLKDIDVKRVSVLFFFLPFSNANHKKLKYYRGNIF